MLLRAVASKPLETEEMCWNDCNYYWTRELLIIDSSTEGDIDTTDTESSSRSTILNA